MTDTQKRIRIYTPEQIARWRENAKTPEKRARRNLLSKSPERKARKAASDKAWREKHRTETNARRRTPEAKEKYRAWVAANRRQVTDRSLRWQKLNRESRRLTTRARQKRMTAEICDYSVKKILKQQYNIKQPTQQEIEICRQRIQIKRMKKLAMLYHAAQRLSKVLLPSAAPSSTAR